MPCENIHSALHYSTDTTSVIETTEPPTKKTRVHKDYLFDEEFPDKQTAIAALNQENVWSYYYENRSSKGLRVSYRCNTIKSRSTQQCEAAVYLLYHAENSNVSLFRSTSAHTHSETSMDAVFKFIPEAEALIREMFARNVKPKAMKFALVEKGFGAPPQSKLESFLKQLRASKYGKEKLHLGTLEAWLTENLNVPNDEREAFIVNFEIDDDETAPRFRFVFN